MGGRSGSTRTKFRVRGARSRLAADERAPGYAKAAETLRRLPDLGAASLEAARARHGDLPLEQLVLHAAAHPVTPPPTKPLEPGAPDGPAAAPSCRTCGTALDPDGTCLTCARKDSR